MRTRIQSPQQLSQSVESLISDELGFYSVVDDRGVELGKAPAIWIFPPQLPKNRRMIEDSGIELSVARSPRLVPKQNAGLNTTIKQWWELLLVQYNRSKTTQVASQLIAHYFPYSEIRTRQQMETEQGLVYEQARITIPEWVAITSEQ